MTWGTRRDLVACFAWKQVELGFLNLASRLVHVASSRRLRRVQAKGGRVIAMGCIRPIYLNFVVFYVLGHRGILVF
jgi:hypothetical protein